MGDNKKKWLWISLGIVAGILVLGYIGTALYFMSHFLCHIYFLLFLIYDFSGNMKEIKKKIKKSHSIKP